MIVSNKEIKNLINEIRCNFGNPQYLSISEKHDFDDIRGTKLWKLWYDLEILSVATLEIEYNRYLCGKYSTAKFYKKLKHLKRCLKFEFIKIKMKIFLRRKLNYD